MGETRMKKMKLEKETFPENLALQVTSVLETLPWSDLLLLPGGTRDLEDHDSGLSNSHLSPTLESHCYGCCKL